MIAYMLKCRQAHEFEVWFGKGSDFDEQAAKGLISCPYCEDTKIEKALMAPNIRTSKSTLSHQDHMTELAAHIRKDLTDNCKDVGDEFAQEARSMHYGKKQAKGIYGRTTPKQARELAEEGIETVALPPAFVPNNNKKLN